MCHSLGCYSLESIPTATLLYRMVYTSNYNTRMIVPRAQAPHITKSTGDIELIYKTAHKDLTLTRGPRTSMLAARHSRTRRLHGSRLLRRRHRSSRRRVRCTR